MAMQWCHLDAPDLTRLDLASVLVRRLLDSTPYLVGSCLTSPDFRDVDVRVVLADEEFERMFGDAPAHPLRHFLEARISEHYARETGLRVDFQIQRQSAANAYPGQRHPLGVYPTGTEG